MVCALQTMAYPNSKLGLLKVKQKPILSPQPQTKINEVIRVLEHSANANATLRTAYIANLKHKGVEIVAAQPLTN